MKKIVTVLTFAVMSMALHGATCVWGASGLALAKSGDDPTTYTAYLCDSAVISLSDLTSNYMDKGDLTWKNDNALVIDSVGLGGSSSAGRIRSQTISDFKTSINADPQEKDTFNFYLVIMNGDNSQYSVLNNLGDVTVSGDKSLSMAFGNQKLGNTWTAVGGTGGDVPEPTSGLLLLMGGALLALRRKQK